MSGTVSRKIKLRDQEQINIFNILISIAQVFKVFIHLPKAMSEIYKTTNKQNPNKYPQFLIFMLSQRIIGLLVFEILQTLGEVIKLSRIKRE